MKVSRLNHLWQLGVIYLSLVLSYNVTVLALRYLLPKPLDLELINYLHISFFIGAIPAIPLLIIVNLLSYLQHFSRFQFNYPYIFVSAFTTNMLVLAFEDYYFRLVPYGLKDTMFVYVYMVGVEVLEFILVAYIMSFLFPPFEEQKDDKAA